MKFLLLVSAMSFSYSGTQVKEGSGHIKEETREVKDFKGISLQHSLQAQLAPGPFKVQIKGDDNLLPYVVTEVSQGVLQLKIKNGVSFSTKNPLEIFIQAPTINSVNLSGASGLTGSLATQDELDVDTSGGSRVKLKRLTVNNLNIDTSGGSSVTVEEFAGKALDIDSSGGSTVALDKMNVNRLKIDASGAAKINLEGAIEKADIDLSGSADVMANQLKAKEVKVQASGASELQVKGAASISGELAGAASLHTSKSAQVDVERSRAARLSQD